MAPATAAPSGSVENRTGYSAGSAATDTGANHTAAAHVTAPTVT